MAHQASFQTDRRKQRHGFEEKSHCRGETPQHSSWVRREGLHPYHGSQGPNVGTHLKKHSETWEAPGKRKPTSNHPAKGPMSP